ncbi:MAG: tetratricopeptide repeat protein [Flavobacteriales bacterium]|nr:tetratricopeptide repeat protein [Flavobacteriales bacterium]
MNSSRISELEALLADEHRPLERVALLLELKDTLLGTDFKRSARLCREALTLAEALGDEPLLANCHCELARALWKTGDLVEAQTHYASSRALYAALGDDNGLAEVYCGLGIVHGSLDDHAHALEFFELGIAASKRAESDVSLAHNLGNMGHVYKGLGDRTTALRYYAKALAIDRELGNEGRQGVSNMLTAIAGVMVFQGEYEGAIVKLEEALVILEEMGNWRGMATTLSNMGITYFKMSDHAKAISLLDRALELAERIHFRVLLPDLHQNLADVYVAMGDEPKALKHLEHRNGYRIEEKRLHVHRNAGRIIGPPDRQ